MCELTGMDLATYRKSLGLSQEECAIALGVKSKSYISGIETGGRAASPRLALKIEQWSGGRVKAASLNPIVAEIIQRASPKRGRAA